VSVVLGGYGSGVDADVAELSAEGFDEFFRLHTAMRDSAIPLREADSAEPAPSRQTAAGAAGGVVDAAFVGGEHLDEEAHDAGPGVEVMNAASSCFHFRAERSQS